MSIIQLRKGKGQLRKSGILSNRVQTLVFKAKQLGVGRVGDGGELSESLVPITQVIAGMENQFDQLPDSENTSLCFSSLVPAGPLPGSFNPVYRNGNLHDENNPSRTAILRRLARGSEKAAA